MIFEFKKAKNGLVLEVTDGEDKETITYQDGDTDEQEIERFRDFLCEINDSYGPVTSRHSKQRIYISVAPGDKYGDGL